MSDDRIEAIVRRQHMEHCACDGDDQCWVYGEIRIAYQAGLDLGRERVGQLVRERDELRHEVTRLECEAAKEWQPIVAALEQERDALRKVLEAAKLALDDIDDMGRDVLIWKCVDLGNQIREACGKATEAIDAALASAGREEGT